MPLSRSSTTVIHLHPAAPDKPLAGAPCNGCGVCCALETCPLARLRYWRSAGPCPALTWSPATGRYLCGLLATPGKLLPMLPESLHPILQKIVRRWIAAGHGCDCNAEVTPPAN